MPNIGAECRCGDMLLSGCCPSGCVQIGDTVKGRAFNGHTMIYNVIGFYADGTVKTSQWDARCADDCSACAHGDIRPDW